jgi:hypothetical protein
LWCGFSTGKRNSFAKRRRRGLRRGLRRGRRRNFDLEIPLLPRELFFIGLIEIRTSFFSEDLFSVPVFSFFKKRL